MSEPAAEPPVQGYRIDHGVDGQTETEAERLSLLASRFDRGSAKLLARLGVGEGWRCWEVGAGQGSMARWLAEVVGPTGSVLATDIDLAFVGEVPGNVTLLEHDVSADAVPLAAGSDQFDLVHTRAVLQHVPERDTALANIVAATRPGGLVVIEDIDWTTFDLQPLPAEFAEVHRALRAQHVERNRYDAHYGRRMLHEMRALGLVDVDSRGTVTTMRGGTPSAEWYVMAIERIIPSLVSGGLVDRATADTALAQARDPDFAVLSPLGISAWGRTPTPTP